MCVLFFFPRIGSTFATQPISTPVAEGDDFRTPAILQFQVNTMEWDLIFHQGVGKLSPL